MTLLAFILFLLTSTSMHNFVILVCTSSITEVCACVMALVGEHPIQWNIINGNHTQLSNYLLLHPLKKKTNVVSMNVDFASQL